MFPQNPDFASINCVVVVLPQLEQFLSILLQVGIGMNIIGELKLPMSFVDKVSLMHEHYWRKVFFIFWIL